MRRSRIKYLKVGDFFQWPRPGDALKKYIKQDVLVRVTSLEEVTNTVFANNILLRVSGRDLKEKFEQYEFDKNHKIIIYTKEELDLLMLGR